MKYAKRIWVVLNLLCIIIIVAFLVISKNFFKSSADNIIGVCYSDYSEGYQRVLNDSIYPAVSEKGDIIHYRDAKNDQERQNSQIRDLVNEGCRLIILIPVNENVKEGIKYAKEKGVYIVAVDRMIRNETGADLNIFSDNYSSGRDLAKYLIVNRMTGNILLICKKDEESVNESAAGFESFIKNERNDKFVIKGIIYTTGTKKDLKEQLTKFKDSDIDTCFCVSDDLAKLAAHELDNIYILSMGGSPDGKRMVSDKRIAATVNQFPLLMGENAVKGAYNILEGKYNAPTVIVPSKIITINTVDLHNMDKWE